MLRYTGKPYDGGLLKPIIDLAKSSELLIGNGGNKKVEANFWASTCQAIAYAKEVYILTYMFEYQDLRYYLELNGIPYEYGGVHHGEDGSYRFCSLEAATTPAYVPSIKEKVNVYYGKGTRDDFLRFNKYQLPKESKTAPQSRFFLSCGWFSKHQDVASTDIKRLLKTYFMSRFRDVPSSRKCWSTFEKAKVCTSDYSTSATEKGARALLSDKMYRAHFIPFNMRASNNYRHKDVLAYLANIFPHPDKKNYIQRNGIEYNDDGYAISIMVQWVWRSAIRCGEPITIWIPSERMRTIFEAWLDHPYIAKERFLEGGEEDA